MGRSGHETGAAPVLLPREKTAGCSFPSDEVLVIDPRGGLTPAQLVEQKLLALLRAGNPGLYAQAAGGPQDVRRTRGGPGDA